MADPSPAPISSIKSRIAALNLEEVHQPAPGSPAPYTYEHAASKKRPPPPPPPAQRSKTTNVPPLQSNAPTSARKIGNQPSTFFEPPAQKPALPPRLPPPTNSNAQAGPALPPRRPSEQGLQRRESAESISTIASGRSSFSVASSKTNLSSISNSAGGEQYRIRAPAYDPSKLPPLPPKRAKEEPKPSRAALKPTQSSPSVVPTRENKVIKPPPALPSRPALPARQTSIGQGAGQVERIKPPPRRSALEFGLNKATETPSLPGPRPGQSPIQQPGSPPPIPLASRPDLAALQASKPKPSAVNSCLKCRDFSGPDSHAARFPRQSIPSHDLAWLAHQLTSPFPSLTDKARAIFIWLHHNIDYNTEAFFNDNVQPSTPAGTISTGLAVCEGYAALFTALASKVGMESVVIGGHGKGYGHSALKPGDPVPPFECGHAWNAVRIDNGEWKLIDCCWGAGHVQGKGQPYVRMLHTECFTMDNNEFGLKHFPEDRSRFYRVDGRAQISWEEYMMNDAGERLTVFSNATPDYGLGERTFQPAQKNIKVYDPQAGPVVRFQFATICPHWDHHKNGKGTPYLFVLCIEGRDGRKSETIPFQTDGHVWWLDIARVELGAPGQGVQVNAITNFNGKDARGLTAAEFKGKMRSWGSMGAARWELV